MDQNYLNGIVDDEPNPLPRYATPNEIAIMQQESLSAIQPGGIGLLEAPSGTVWTPGEYEAVYGALISWGSYNALLTEFIVGVTTDPHMDSLAFVIINGASQQASAYTTLLGASADMDRVKFIDYDTNTVWIRDYGPRYVAEDGFPAIIDHTYNRPRPLDNALPAWIGANSVPFIQNEPVYEMDLTHGGGNFHAVSIGEAFMSTLIEDENTGKTTQQIIDIVESHFNTNLTIYPKLIYNVDLTGHIDMWLLPVSDDTIIVSEFPTSHPISKAGTDAAAADLQSRGFTVYRTPAYNSTGESSGGTHYTYTNTAIINHRVFIPEYGRTHSSFVANDNAALKWSCMITTAIPVRTSPMTISRSRPWRRIHLDGHRRFL